MAPALEDGIPAHLRRNIDATLAGKRDIFKPPPRKQPAAVPIPLTAADLDLEAALLPGGVDGSVAGPYGAPSTVWNSTSYGGAGGTAVTSASSRVPTMDQLFASASTGPAVMGASRLVGHVWVRQQERQWFRSQVAKREERVNTEAERLFLAAIGPIGMDQSVWAKLPEKVEAVARRNIQREEALELHRLRLEEWNPQVVSKSARLAVLAALDAAREGASSREDPFPSPGSMGPDFGGEQDLAAMQYLRNQGSESTLRVAGGNTALAATAAAGAGPGPGPRGGDQLSPRQRRRAMSALPHRYMETDLERHRMVKALDKLAAKKADTTPPSTMPGAAPSAAASVPSSSPRDGSVSASAALSATASVSSPMALLRTLRARREERWNRESGVLAARMAHFMELESPVSPRLSRATAASAAADKTRANGKGAGSPQGNRPRTSSGAAGGGGGAGVAAELGGRDSMSGRVSASGPGGRSARFSLSGKFTDPSGRPGWPGQQDAEEEELPADKAALAARLVSLYEAACMKHRQHVEAAVVTALKRSCAAVPGLRGHQLRLEALNLTSREVAEVLAEVLGKCEHISALTLERCAVTVEALSVVLPALWRLPLRRLQTINTDFPPASWPLLQRALGRPTVWGAEAAWWLSLRQLSLAGNGIADQGLSALVEVLVAMPQLESLTLRQCGVSDLSAPHMERLLGECGALKELDVGYNNLGPKAVGALARGLHKAKHLTKLAVPWNSVGGGVAQLCWTVMRLGPRHCKLASLDLAGTDLVAQDLFGIAAIVRAWPHTPLRHLNLSDNNMVGVAGQCLLRQVNRLLQPLPTSPPQPQQEPGAPGGGPGELGSGGGGSVAGQTATATSPGGGYASPTGAAGAPYGRTPGPSWAVTTGVDGGGGRPLVPILKMPGPSGGGASGSNAVQAGGGGRGDSPVKRLTINLNPQLSGPPGASSPSQLQQLQPPLTPRSDDSPSRRTSFSSLSFQAVPPQAAPQAAASSPTAAAAGATGTTSRARRAAAAAVPEPEPLAVVTSGCVVVPALPPGSMLLVRPDGSALVPLGPAGSRGDDEDEDDARMRARTAARERDRERERERMRRLGEEQAAATAATSTTPSAPGTQSGQDAGPVSPGAGPGRGSGDGGAGGTSAPASPSAGPAARLAGRSSGGPPSEGPGPHAQANAAAPADGRGASPVIEALAAGAGTGAAAAAAALAAAAAELPLRLVDAAAACGGGPNAHWQYRVALDLAQELPDRVTAVLLLEHELEARRHGYRSAFYGLKYQGRVHRRDGQDVVPLDPMYLGWTHSLPREGLLELLVLALPPQLCPWLANPRLHCNAQGG